MINNSLIYHNPIIPQGYYYAKVIRCEAEPADFHFPKLLIYLKPHHSYNLNNVILASIIHPTINSQFHYGNFWNTYAIWANGDINKTINQHGSILVYNAEYNGTEYSAVKYVYQPMDVRYKACKLTAGEGE